MLAPEHPCLVCLPPHAEPAGAAVGDADVVVGSSPSSPDWYRKTR